MSFLGEIKRRKVFQVAAVYAVVAWLLIQVVDVVAEPLTLPDWIDAVVIVLLAVGFPIAVILGWAFDLTPQGIQVTSDLPASDSPNRPSGQRLNYVTHGLVLLAVGFLLADQYLLDSGESTSEAGSVGAASEPSPVNRFALTIPDTPPIFRTGRSVIAVAPDGRSFAYNTTDGIYLRSMSELEPRLIPGTEEDRGNPFFSADGRSLAYWAASLELKRIPLGGGAARTIADNVANVYGATWGHDDTILFGQPEGIFRVSANGGAAELVIPADEGELLYGPTLLPDEDSVLFSVGAAADWDRAQIVVQSLSSGERKLLVSGGADARYLRTGHLIYAFGDELLAVRFDVTDLTVSGEAVSMVRGIARSTGAQTGSAQLGVSADGILVYVAGRSLVARTLVWTDRDGREETISTEPRLYVTLRLSPDRRLLALDEGDVENNLWVWNLENETETRLTLGPLGGDAPVWTRDGRRIAYHPLSGNVIDWHMANNTGSPANLITGASATGTEIHPYFFTPSGMELVFDGQSSPASGDDVGMIAIDDDNAEPVWLLNGPYNERNAELSPDGRWMAYQSDESGTMEISVRPFPNVNDDLVVVSNSGGVTPLWSPSGAELFYVEPAGLQTKLIAVSVETSETAFRFTARTPILNWEDPGTANYRNYDVSSDGDAFLSIRRTGNEADVQIVVVQNWFEELNRLAPPSE